MGLVTGSGASINGNVGIGTLETGEHKLAVEGSILAKELTIQPEGSTFLGFTNPKDLPTLEELNQFIKDKKHLPDIPTVEEINRNGIKLGDISATLLKKIEQLTIYIINQNEQNIAQQKIIADLEKRLTLLEQNRTSQLEIASH